MAATILRKTLTNFLKSYPKRTTAFSKLPQKEAPNNQADANKTAVIEKLKQLFHIRDFNALDIVMNNKKLATTPEDLIETNFQLCKRYKMKFETMMAHADILAQKDDLRAKLSLLRTLPFSLSVTAPLLSLTQGSLVRLKNRLEEDSKDVTGGRIALFAQLFEVSEEWVCVQLVKKPFLRNIDILLVEERYKLLIDYGIDLDQIKNDLWVFSYSTEHIKERLDFAKANNVEDLKPWMVRATEEIFETYLKRRQDNKSVLGNNSLMEYLAHRLECSLEVAKLIVAKHPALNNKSMKKMQEIIDFLYLKGFKPIHIRKIPKILLHSVETTRKRLREMEAVDMHIDSLYMLTKSQKQYQQYYESLLKSKNKQLEEKGTK